MARLFPFFSYQNEMRRIRTVIIDRQKNTVFDVFFRNLDFFALCVFGFFIHTPYYKRKLSPFDLLWLIINNVLIWFSCCWYWRTSCSYQCCVCSFCNSSIKVLCYLLCRRNIKQTILRLDNFLSWWAGLRIERRGHGPPGPILFTAYELSKL